MQGILDYFSPSGQLISKELSKGLTAFGQAVLEWQPARATWMISAPNAPVLLRVNGRDLPHGSRISLSHLDTVTVGTTNARFLRIPALPLIKSKPCSEVVLSRKKLIIGRTEGEGATDVTQHGEDRWNLDPEDRSISKVHVEIQAEAGGFTIYDRSRTGTYLNGSVFQPRALIPGDRFNIGSYYFEFTGSSVRCVDQVSGARVEGRDLVLDVPHDGGTRRILKAVSIEIKAGEFLGVLGGSGQGKSTLMNILAGLSLATDGQVIMDGVPLATIGWRNGAVGFVPQDDIVHHELTVREAITLTARLRLAVSAEGIETLVSGILQRLGLQKQQGQPIRSLSGGQRKRVNIATELLARPPVLFLDEPTSGLDPENEESVISTLQNLRLTGQTVICTTHSLHKAYLFDRIAFIHDGRLMFLGTQDEARSHFLEIKDATATDSSGPSIKLERIYKLLSQQADAEKWEQKFATSPLAPFRPTAPPPPRRVVASTHRVTRPGFFTTLSVLIQTQWRILCADPRNWKSLLLQAVGIGALAGWVGRDDPEFRFFACLIATLWFGCSNAAQTITHELPIFRRERIAGLGLHPYILSKSVFLSIISWLQVLLLLMAQALPVVLSGLDPKNPARDLFPALGAGTALFAIAFALAGVVGVMIGLSLSSHARTTTQATLWVPLVLIPQILFSGFVVTLPEMPTWARVFSYAVPSASAQRLLDAGNVSDKRVPLMTDRTEVPLFFATEFERENGKWDIQPGTNAHKLVPEESIGRSKKSDNKYRELDEYNTAWQNTVVDSAAVGFTSLPTPGKDNFVYERKDVPTHKSGDLYRPFSSSVTASISLLAWVVICYSVIWAGLTLAQPETLHPAWARWIGRLGRKRVKKTSRR